MNSFFQWDCQLNLIQYRIGHVVQDDDGNSCRILTTDIAERESRYVIEEEGRSEIIRLVMQLDILPVRKIERGGAKRIYLNGFPGYQFGRQFKVGIVGEQLGSGMLEPLDQRQHGLLADLLDRLPDHRDSRGV